MAGIQKAGAQNVAAPQKTNPAQQGGGANGAQKPQNAQPPTNDLSKINQGQKNTVGVG